MAGTKIGGPACIDEQVPELRVEYTGPGIRKKKRERGRWRLHRANRLDGVPDQRQSLADVLNSGLRIRILTPGFPQRRPRASSLR